PGGGRRHEDRGVPGGGGLPRHGGRGGGAEPGGGGGGRRGGRVRRRVDRRAPLHVLRRVTVGGHASGRRAAPYAPDHGGDRGERAVHAPSGGTGRAGGGAAPRLGRTVPARRGQGRPVGGPGGVRHRSGTLRTGFPRIARPAVRRPVPGAGRGRRGVLPLP